MLETLNQLDTRLFWAINGAHAGVLDWVMWVASQWWSWAVVLLVALGALTMRREPRMWWVVLTGIALCFLLSDRVSVICFKDVVCRLRPCYALDGVRMFRTSCGGMYGFVSSHAANVFALAMFFSLRYGSRRRWGWVVPVAFFAWALLVGYSRPYLGKHYPGDVMCGAVVGLAMGALSYFVMEKIAAFVEKRRAERNKR